MSDASGRSGAQTAVVEVAGVSWASEKATVESVLGRRPGVLSVAANPVGQTATVTYRPRPDVGDRDRRVDPRLRLPLLRAVGARRTCARSNRTQLDEERKAQAAGGHEVAGQRARAARHWPGTATCRWRRWSPTCATGSSSPPCSSVPILLWSTDRPRRVRLRRRRAVRAARRRVPARPQPAGGLLLGLDLLRPAPGGRCGPARWT